jgi:hypothetical protein
MAVTQNKAVTAQGLKTKNALCTAAKVTYNDAANAVKLMDAGPNGSILYKLVAIPRMTVTACQLQLYRSPDAGVTLNLIETQLMGAYTMSQITQAPQTAFSMSETAGLRLAIGDSLYVATGVAFTTGVMFDGAAEDL